MSSYSLNSLLSMHFTTGWGGGSDRELLHIVPLVEYRSDLYDILRVQSGWQNTSSSPVGL